MKNDTDVRSGILIHIGSPSAEQVADYRAQELGTLVFVVPKADVATRLERALAQETGVQVVHAVIAAVEGDAILRSWNLSRLDGIAEPTPLLLELYPSLHLRASSSVPLLTPGQLMEQIGKPAGPVHLVIEVPGSEFAVLQAWDEACLLDDLSHVTLRIPEAVLFEGAEPRAEVEAWIVAQGFTVTSRDLTDPDWPRLSVHAAPLERRLARAERRVVDLDKIIAERDKAVSEAEAKADAIRKDAENRIAELEQALSKSQAQAETFAEARADAEAARKDVGARITELDKALSEAKAQLETQAKARNEALAKREKAMDDLAMATRLQGMLQADITDLRIRFARSEETRAAQETLLRDLTPRLQEAAEQLRTMRLFEDRAAAASIAAPTGRADKAKRSKSGKSQRSKKAAHVESNSR